MNLTSTDDDALHEAAGDAAEMARAVRISLCGLDLGQAASFLPASVATAEFDWQKWLGEVFLDEIGPAFVEMFQAAGATQVRELIRTDRWLKSESSRVAGSALLERLEEAKNLRVIERMRELLPENEGPHFATAFAVECAEFHLPLRSAVVSYLYGEWRCGLAELGERGDLDAFAEAGGEIVVKVVGEVISRSAGPFGQESHAAEI